MAHHAAGGVVPQDPLQALGRGIGAVAHDDLAGVNRVAHADSAAVVDRDPGRSAGRVEQRIQQRPVGDGVRAVAHGFRFAVGAGHRSRIQMVPADHHWSRELPTGNHVVEGHTEAIAISEPHPANASRQTLERDALARHVQPVVQMRVVRDQLLHLRVGSVDVLRVPGEGNPPEGPDAAREKRANVGGHEAGEVEGVLHPGIEGLLADVVAVVDGRDPLFVKREHRSHVNRHGPLGRRGDLGRVGGGCFPPLLQLPADGQIAVDGIVSRGLVGYGVRVHAPLDELRQHLRCVAQQANRGCLIPRARIEHGGYGLVQIGGLPIQIPGA